MPQQDLSAPTVTRTPVLQVGTRKARAMAVRRLTVGENTRR